MVTVLPPVETFGEKVGRGLGGGISQGFGQMLQNFMQKKQEEQKFSQQLGLEKYRAEQEFADKLGLQREKYGLERENQAAKLKGEYEADEKNYETMKGAFGEKFADVWLAAGQGERTALTNAALEARARGIDLEQILGMAEENMPQQQEMEGQHNIAPEEQQLLQELQNIIRAQDEGLLPEEKIARGKERYSTGLKAYQEAGTKLRGMARDKERLDILDRLNKSGKLPTNFGRLNVDKAGNLKFPFAASPEAQRYVKTLNEFSSGAKDTFGSRVTNFDLAQYLQRFPTLLNTKEGRDQLLQQMRIVNQINSVYYKNLKNVYDKAGGVRNIDSDVAERLAEQLSEAKVDELAKKFQDIGEEREITEETNEQKSKVPAGMILMYDPNGNPLHVSPKDVEKLSKLGAKRA